MNLEQGNPAAEPVQPEQNQNPEFALDADREVVLNPEGKEPGAPQEETVQPYTAEEIRQQGIDKLDPNRIPPELVPFYKSMQADYVRKTQAVAEQRRQIEAFIQQQRAQQSQPEAAPEQQSDVLYEASRIRACQMMGISPEQFDEYDGRHITYLTAATNDVIRMAQERQNQLADSQRREYEFNALMQHYEQTEPNFEKISQWAYQYVESLPYREYQRFMGVLGRGSIEDIHREIESLRNKYYSQQRQTANPPDVEGAGGGDDREGPKRMAASSFAKMTPDEQARFLRENGYV